MVAREGLLHRGIPYKSLALLLLLLPGILGEGGRILIAMYRDGRKGLGFQQRLKFCLLSRERSSLFNRMDTRLQMQCLGSSFFVLLACRGGVWRRKGV